MVSVCTVPARGGRSCEHFGGYKTLNRIPLPLPLCVYTVCIHRFIGKYLPVTYQMLFFHRDMHLFRVHMCTQYMCTLVV